METRELLELMVLIKIFNAIRCVKPNKDGRRITTTENGDTLNVDHIEQRTKELLSKFLEPYKIKE